MTQLDAPPTDPPTPSQRRHLHTRWWWILATVALGALIGSGLAVWAAPGGEVVSGEVAPDTTTTSATAGGPEVPGGLIGGGTPTSAAITRTIDNRVFVVGDSVMQGAAPYLGDLLDDWSIIADTRVGRFLDEANRVIEKRRKDIGQVAVLNLGNNYNGDEEAFAADVETALTELAGVEHVIWIDVGEFEDDRAEVNDALRTAATTHPNLTIVDWNSWWEDNPDFTGNDRLHLTPEGAKAYAALVASAVRQVTQAAGEVPAPGVKPPKLNTSGRIPSSSSSGSSGSSGSKRSGGSSGSTRHSTTTRPSTATTSGGSEPQDPSPTTPTPTTPAVTSPPVTSAAPPTTAR